MLRSSLLFVVAAIGLIALVSITPSAASQSGQEFPSFTKSIQVSGAKPAGSEMCATCHADLAGSFRHTYHAQQSVQCEDCHGNGSLHVEGGGDTTKIIAINKRTAAEANGVCLSCHAQDQSTRHWTSGVHAANGVRCVDCHQIHGDAGKSAAIREARFDTAAHGAADATQVSPEAAPMVQPRSVINNACLKCHATERAQLSMPYHHPLREGKMSCVDCHDAHGGTAGKNLRMANTNELCLSCHAQYLGPFAYQHPPVSESCLHCHNAHGSPNTNLLQVSEPALCLQCHSGHHNGASLPVTDRCTNCHSSIHGTDIATPSGGSRFMDKGPLGVPSEPSQAAPVTPPTYTKTSPKSRSVVVGVTGGALGLLALPHLHAAPAANAASGNGDSGGGQPAAPLSASSITPAAYRFLDITGFPGRAGEYDTLEQSGGSSVSSAYVLPSRHLTLITRGALITSRDYSLRSQLTVANWLKARLDLRSLVQQQDHYLSYLAQLSPSDFGLPGAVTDLIPANSVFGVTRRLADGAARITLPNLPVHLFVNGAMEARAGTTQLTYLDENSTPAVDVGGVNTTCGQLCHQQSQFQPVNYTTRNVGGGAEVRLMHFLQFSLEHDFSSFRDRLPFPTIAYTGPFTPENEGSSIVNPPPQGPAPTDIPAGNYFFDPPSPSQYSADRLNMNLTPSDRFTIDGQASYTRLRNTFTRSPQNWFDSDETLSWLPQARLRVTADHHQQNMINGFTPHFSMYGNVSYHRHWEGVGLEAELPAGFDVEAHYKRSGITRSNAFLWPQIYSIDNTDLLTVVPSTTSDTAGVALRYHSGLVNAAAGDEWVRTHHPGFLIVPQDENRIFVDLTLTPASWLVFSNNARITVQNAFPSVPLPNTPNTAQGFGGDIAGLPLDFQRRDRFYDDTASAALHFVPGWDLGVGYSYQQNDLNTYMAFQNDSAVNYVVDQANVPFKQLSQVVWAESTYLVKDRLGLNLRLTHNGSGSGYRPDLNPNDASQMGNAALIQQGVFDPAMFQSALDNLALSSTQISEVQVPQWIGQGKAYYILPYKIEAGTVFYYGSYRDHWNPNLNGVLRTFDAYIGRSW